MGCLSVRTSWAVRLLGLLGLFVCEDFLGFSSVRTSWALRLLGLLGLSSVRTSGATCLSRLLLVFTTVRTSWAFRLLGLLRPFVC